MAVIEDGLKNFLKDVNSLVQEGENDRVDITDEEILNTHFVCPLCKGYFYDATTIAECLHTFCKPCIVKHFSNIKNKKQCPTCQTPTHGTNPFESLRSDRQIQDLLYAILPDVFKAELKIEKSFWQEKNLPLPEKILNIITDVNFNLKDDPDFKLDLIDLENEKQEVVGIGADTKVKGLVNPEDIVIKKELNELSEKLNLVDSKLNSENLGKFTLDGKNQYENINTKYHNPFSYLHLHQLHSRKLDQVIKFKLIGLISSTSKLEETHIIKCGERATVAELKILICELFRKIVNSENQNKLNTIKNVKHEEKDEMMDTEEADEGVKDDSTDRDLPDIKIEKISPENIKLAISCQEKKTVHVSSAVESRQNSLPNFYENYLILPPFQNENVNEIFKSFPLRSEPGRNFDEITTLGMLQNYAYCLSGNAELCIKYSF